MAPSRSPPSARRLARSTRRFRRSGPSGQRRDLTLAQRDRAPHAGRAAGTSRRAARSRRDRAGPRRRAPRRPRWQHRRPRAPPASSRNLRRSAAAKGSRAPRRKSSALGLGRLGEPHERLHRPRGRGARALAREVGGRRRRGASPRAPAPARGRPAGPSATSTASRRHTNAAEGALTSARRLSVSTSARSGVRRCASTSAERSGSLSGSIASACTSAASAAAMSPRPLMPERHAVEELALHRPRHVRALGEPRRERGREALPARGLGGSAPLGVGRVRQAEQALGERLVRRDREGAEDGVERVPRVPRAALVEGRRLRQHGDALRVRACRRQARLQERDRGGVIVRGGVEPGERGDHRAERAAHRLVLEVEPREERLEAAPRLSVAGALPRSRGRTPPPTRRGCPSGFDGRSPIRRHSSAARASSATAVASPSSRATSSPWRPAPSSSAASASVLSSSEPNVRRTAAQASIARAASPMGPASNRAARTPSARACASSPLRFARASSTTRELLPPLARRERTRQALLGGEIARILRERGVEGAHCAIHVARRERDLRKLLPRRPARIRGGLERGEPLQHLAALGAAACCREEPVERSGGSEHRRAAARVGLAGRVEDPAVELHRARRVVELLLVHGRRLGEAGRSASPPRPRPPPRRAPRRAAPASPAARRAVPARRGARRKQARA